MNKHMFRGVRFGAIGLAGILLALSVACATEGDGATVSPTPSATPSATPEPTLGPGEAPSEPADADALADYEAALARWEAAGLDSYRLTLLRNCFCTEEFRGPFAIMVTDGSISEALFGDEPAQEDAVLTVEQVFEEIERALTAGLETEITYDETLGYPLTVKLDVPAIAADGGLWLELSELVAID